MHSSKQKIMGVYQPNSRALMGLGAPCVGGNSPTQRGMVLIAALIILLLVTLVGTSGVRTGVLELQFATNEEHRLLALQTAQAAVDEITESSSNFVVFGQPGAVTKCTSGLQCQDNSLTFTSSALSAVDHVEIQRIYPAQGNPPRMRSASSARAFRATYFQVEVDNDQQSHGRAQVVQGFMRLITNVR